MKTILIPTDFGDDADRLVRAGLAYSARMDARLVMLYSVEQVGVVTATPPYAVYETNKLQYRKGKDHALEAYRRVFDRFRGEVPGDAYLELVIEKGDRIANIISTVHGMRPDLLILPGEHEGIVEKIMGESNSRIIQQVNVPVCLVPLGGSMTEPARIGVLLEYGEAEFEAFCKVIEFVRQLGGSMVILHPAGQDEFRSKLLYEGFIKESAPLTGDLNPLHLRLDDTDLAEQIRQLIRKDQLDQLVLINHDEHAPYHWFRHTTAEKLSDRLQITMLVFPVDLG